MKTLSDFDFRLYQLNCEGKNITNVIENFKKAREEVDKKIVAIKKERKRVIDDEEKDKKVFI